MVYAPLAPELTARGDLQLRVLIGRLEATPDFGALVRQGFDNTARMPTNLTRMGMSYLFVCKYSCVRMPQVVPLFKA